jgi:hypothetical protein
VHARKTASKYTAVHGCRAAIGTLATAGAALQRRAQSAAPPLRQAETPAVPSASQAHRRLHQHLATTTLRDLGLLLWAGSCLQQLGDHAVQVGLGDCQLGQGAVLVLLAHGQVQVLNLQQREKWSPWAAAAAAMFTYLLPWLPAAFIIPNNCVQMTRQQVSSITASSSALMEVKRSSSSMTKFAVALCLTTKSSHALLVRMAWHLQLSGYVHRTNSPKPCRAMHPQLLGLQHYSCVCADSYSS